MAGNAPIKFVDDDPEVIRSKAKSYYEGITNRTLNDADPEAAVVNTIAYINSLTRNDINYTGNQNLVRYATGAALEELGFNRDVTRLPAVGARCIMIYTALSSGGGVTIPKGNRVKSEDGKVVFQTLKDATIGSGGGQVKVDAICLTTGEAGNNYAAGKINIILDPVTNVISAVNANVTSGGADEETDDQLRERIEKAPAKFSVAGPEDAYIYYAKTAHPEIVDVKVLNPAPLEINIYPLMDGGVIPDINILNTVLETVSPKNIRPLNDIVTVYAPTKIDYSINYKLVVRKDVDANAALNEANDRITAFVAERKNKLGVDVVVKQIEAVLGADLLKIYKAILLAPLADIVAQPNVYMNCTGITGVVDSIADE